MPGLPNYFASCNLSSYREIEKEKGTEKTKRKGRPKLRLARFINCFVFDRLLTSPFVEKSSTLLAAMKVFLLYCSYRYWIGSIDF